MNKLILGGLTISTLSLSACDPHPMKAPVQAAVRLGQYRNLCEMIGYKINITQQEVNVLAFTRSKEAGAPSDAQIISYREEYKKRAEANLSIRVRRYTDKINSAMVAGDTEEAVTHLSGLYRSSFDECSKIANLPLLKGHILPPQDSEIKERRHTFFRKMMHLD